MTQAATEMLDLASARADMVRHQLRQIRDERVLRAMSEVPRHLFVPPHLVARAYEDTPLPIGYGQTISQPLMVALMLEAAQLQGTERVLDVGTGSGYQAALLAHLAREVYSIEIIPALAETARQNLARANISGVEVIIGDGSMGWPAAAPYDAILVAAAAPEIPEPLVAQLSLGGRLIIPVGPLHYQTLMRITRFPDGIETEELELCGFVPLVGAHGIQA